MNSSDDQNSILSQEGIVRPSFIGIGAPKTASTSLHHYLSQHPDLFLPEMKEPAFFASDGPRKIESEEEYFGLFSGCEPGRIPGEVSARYLHSERAASEIWRSVPSVRLIAFLRHPVDRAFSDFEMLKSTRFRIPDMTFAEAIRRVHEERDAHPEVVRRVRTRSLYAQPLSRFYELFDPAHIRVYLYEEFRSDPELILRDIFEFLGADASFSIDTETRHNPARGIPTSPGLRRFALGDTVWKRLIRSVTPRSTLSWMKSKFMRNWSASGDTLDPDDRRAFLGYFRQDIARTEELTGMDLSVWAE